VPILNSPPEFRVSGFFFGQGKFFGCHVSHETRPYFNIDLDFNDHSQENNINHFNMSSNVGLSTPRGSGTSGYVQRNLAQLKPRDKVAPYSKDLDSLKHRQRQPDKEILDHDRKREVELKVFELRDELEDKEYVHPPNSIETS